MLLDNLENNVERTPNDQFDLVEFFHSFQLMIVRKIGLIFITFLVGISIGLLLYFTAKPKYTSQMTGFSESLKIEVVIGIIDDLQRTLDDKNIALGEHFLGLSAQKIKAIDKLTCKPAIEKGIYEKDESGIFIIEATVFDNNVFDSLSIALEHYFQENYYVKRKTKLENALVKQQIINIDIETKSLYELQDNMNEAISKNTFRSNLFLSDIGYASSKIVELLDKRANHMNRLQQLEEIKVLKNFVKFSKRSTPHLFKTLISGEIICFTILILFFLTRSFIRHIKSLRLQVSNK